MDITKLTWCPQNVTYSKTWLNYGMSTCTTEITGSLVILLYTLIFGTHHSWKYKIYKTDVDCDKVKINGLYLLQILLLLLMPIWSLFSIILQAHRLYGHMIISTISTFIIYPYSIFLLRVERYKILSGQSNSRGIILHGFWILSFFMETTIFIHSSNDEWFFKWITKFSQPDTAVFTLRYLSSLLIFSLGLFASGDTGSKVRYSSVKDDAKIGSTFHQSPSIIGSSSYAKTWHKFKSLAIFLWPKEDIVLQLRMILSFVLLFSGNVVNALRPLYEKKIIDSVTAFPGQFRWELVVIYVGIDVFQEIATDLKAFLWNPVEQYTGCKVEVEIFRHLHSLSLRWHLERKTGEVLRMMDRGTSAIHSLMYYMLFDILPLIADTVLAVIFFISIFDKWLGLIVFISIIFYLILTIAVTEWRSKIQEQRNEAENNQRSRNIDSLLNFETVKYYGAESYEVETYKNAILDSQRQETLSDTTSYFFDILRNLIDNFAILAGSLLCLYMIVNNQGLTIGDYALFTSYISQLQRPLAGFAFSYKFIYESFVDMDCLFSLFEEKQEVCDLPDAEPLKIDEGRIQFSNVSFSYTRERPVLKNVNFSVPPGKTIALVGPSGAGKSTIVRLLFRFYDVNEGAILIDGQDVKTVKQDSLRQAIGVVPQDTVLFNDTIKFNIQYGKIEASEEEVIEAAKNADIHDRILTFPDGYKTEVGERGLRLSGGEKQRVAIARTILKAPKIILLDEATSALDTQTERNIQAALNRVCANRTTIIIAHRLSTIIHADEILVLKEGEIIERGRHEDLLLQCGVYHKMWEAQFTKEKENTEEKGMNEMSE